MEKLNSFMAKIPVWLSSKVSIFIYLFLFFYLVIFAVLCAVLPALKSLMPSDMTQLILGNYTNVLSALGASIAAGSGVAVHQNIKVLHQRHEKLLKTVEELHQKIDDISKTSKK